VGYTLAESRGCHSWPCPLLFLVAPVVDWTLKRGESLSVRVLPNQAGKMITGKEGLFSRVSVVRGFWVRGQS